MSVQNGLPGSRGGSEDTLVAPRLTSLQYTGGFQKPDGGRLTQAGGFVDGNMVGAYVVNVTRVGASLLKPGVKKSGLAPRRTSPKPTLPAE